MDEILGDAINVIHLVSDHLFFFFNITERGAFWVRKCRELKK